MDYDIIKRILKNNTTEDTVVIFSGHSGTERNSLTLGIQRHWDSDDAGEYDKEKHGALGQFSQYTGSVPVSKWIPDVKGDEIYIHSCFCNRIDSSVGGKKIIAAGDADKVVFLRIGENVIRKALHAKMDEMCDK